MNIYISDFNSAAALICIFWVGNHLKWFFENEVWIILNIQVTSCSLQHLIAWQFNIVANK